MNTYTESHRAIKVISHSGDPDLHRTDRCLSGESGIRFWTTCLPDRQGQNDKLNFKLLGKIMKSKAVQDYYPDDVAHCYGCGKLNEHGHQIKTFWEGDETVTRFTPKDYHTAIPGYVYGGLIASLIDCHGTGTAALAAYKAEGREIDTLPPFRFVTASLQVDYLKPTPLGVELEIRGKVIEIKGRKVISEITLSANGEVTAKGKVVAVQIYLGEIK